MADRVYVLDDGKIVEHGPADDVLTRPRHPHTRRLLYRADDQDHGSGLDLTNRFRHQG
jgi:ABC-type dipeptide/oligopeptide/nickel transport system ATPase component